MPVFHTKTIEQILEPVANQVSQLVIIHEAGEDGAPVPSLEAPINAVESAVMNLAKVGRQQVQSSKDEVLKMDTPPAIDKVEHAATLLKSASTDLGQDPYSKSGREKLISGARGILQGTSDLLLVFDEAEVRRICQVCQGVREYLKVSEVVQEMENLVTYVKNLSPGMTNMSRMVSQRSEELTNVNHAEKLAYEINSLKTQLPNLISSMKAFVSTLKDGGRAKEAAVNNRKFYVNNISSGITEIIRLLQLVSTDQELQYDPTTILALHKLRDAMAKKMQSAKSWLDDGNALAGTPGEIALRELLDNAREIGNQSGDALGQKILSQCNDIDRMANRLAELRKQGKGNTAEARRIAAQIQNALDNLIKDVDQALQNANELSAACDTIVNKTPVAKEWLADVKAKPGAGTGSEAARDIISATRKAAKLLSAKPNGSKTAQELNQLCDELDALMNKMDDYRNKDLGHLLEARQVAKQATEKVALINSKVLNAVSEIGIPSTLEEKMDGALKWLDNLNTEDAENGMSSVHSIINDARKLAAEVNDPQLSKALYKSAATCEDLLRQIDDLVQRGLGDSPEAKQLAQKLKTELGELKDLIKNVLVNEVADEFADTTTVLKQFVAAAQAPKDSPNREENFDARALALSNQASRLADLAKQAVSASSLGAQDKLDAVKVVTKKLNNLTPQVIHAGSIVLEHPENKQAEEHFKALREEWIETVDDLTEKVDNSVDVSNFVKATEDGIRREHQICVDAMRNNEPLKALPAAGNIARRAHRLLMAGKREVENTEDTPYKEEVNGNLNKISSTINPVVQATRDYALDHHSTNAQNNVVDKNENLIDAVTCLRKTMEAKKVAEQVQQMTIQEPPPVPPLPEQINPPERPPLPEEEEFPEDDHSNEASNPAMMQAARELHEEARKWESKGNDIISAAKRMALLMAKMSRLVKGEGGKKSDLISCAKEIAKASGDVTRLANEVADKCTDRRIRNDMKKTLDRIPTISTQLRILSTVKAASLGDFENMSKEEEAAAEQATEMIVHNAQNLMMSVKDTVKYAEAASIRIRTDTGVTMRWVRKS
uniref:Vinculin n=1 Tax=Phallusia mammillata TaxID=59560 RepID=A0A6F9DA00_9ASCI|nr:vinculin-like [Phallusia mammillata]